MTTRRLDALGAVIATIRRIDDVPERLAAIRAIRGELSDHVEQLEDAVRDAILDARALPTPLTFEQIGEILGVSRARVHQLAEPRKRSLTPS